MCNYRHPGPRRVWEVGPEPQSLTPFPSLRRLRRRVPKTAKMILYASLQSSRPPAPVSRCAQAMELVNVAALQCRREHRETIFERKRAGVGQLFGVFWPGGAKYNIFTMSSTLPDDQDLAYSDIFQLWPHRTQQGLMGGFQGERRPN